MRIDIVTLFPAMFSGPINESIVKKAQEKGKVKIFICNLRNFGLGRHRTCDDRPYGGGPGMVLKPEPIWKALQSVKKETKDIRREKRRIILLSPRGKVFSQKEARRLSQYKHLVLLCGHYEGVDARVIDWVDEEISIGDYILTGGEIPALVLVDSITRLLGGVLGKAASLRSESFSGRFLEYPQYTRPYSWRGKSVPEVLLSGNHRKIALWRKEQAMKKTYFSRPDLLEQIHLSKEEKRIIARIKRKIWKN